MLVLNNGINSFWLYLIDFFIIVRSLFLLGTTLFLIFIARVLKERLLFLRVGKLGSRLLLEGLLGNHNIIEQLLFRKRDLRMCEIEDVFLCVFQVIMLLL
jgi:hypothetical protein